MSYCRSIVVPEVRLRGSDKREHVKMLGDVTGVRVTQGI